MRLCCRNWLRDYSQVRSTCAVIFVYLDSQARTFRQSMWRVCRSCSYRCVPICALTAAILVLTTILLDDCQSLHGPRLHGESAGTASPRGFNFGMERIQAHGYATHEFEVTEERLGVYLPVRKPVNQFVSLCTPSPHENAPNRRSISTIRKVILTMLDNAILNCGRPLTYASFVLHTKVCSLWVVRSAQGVGDRSAHWNEELYCKRWVRSYQSPCYS